jgi:hypothetical protein
LNLQAFSPGVVPSHPKVAHRPLVWKRKISVPITGEGENLGRGVVRL